MKNFQTRNLKNSQRNKKLRLLKKTRESKSLRSSSLSRKNNLLLYAEKYAARRT
nr:MAG TPA: hypothetical protein [Caudoviricetes sp.]